MSAEPVIVQLNWEDPATGESQYASRQLPVAIGREAGKMPVQLEQLPVSHLELSHQQVSRCHAVISMVNRQLFIADQSANGTFINGRLIQKTGQVFTAKDTIRIGTFKITVTVVNKADANSTELNREYSHVAKAGMGASGTEANALLGWIVGGVVVVLLGIGLLVGARTLLNRTRPSVEDSPQSRLDMPLLFARDRT